MPPIPEFGSTGGAARKEFFFLWVAWEAEIMISLPKAASHRLQQLNGRRVQVGGGLFDL